MKSIGKKNKLISIGVFLFLGIILTIAFVLAAHIITTSTGGSSYSVNESVVSTYNITVTNTDIVAGNITEVNITIPDTFTFIAASNGTNATGHTFTNTTRVLNWSNASLVENGTSVYFSFNANASAPGSYNLTIVTSNSTGIVNTTNISVEVNDTTAPFWIDFVDPTPINNSNLSQSYIEANISVNDSFSNISIIRIYLYNSTGLVNNTNVSAVGGLNATGFINFSSIILPDGVYYLNATANDTAGNENTTGPTITITLDRTEPSSIEFISPTPDANSNLSQDYIPVNISVNDSYTAIDTIRIYLYNSTGLVNNTNVSATGGLNATGFINFTSLTDGVYYINATANDSAGNENITVPTITITLDAAGPSSIEFISPSPVANANLSQAYIPINISVNDSYTAIDTIRIYLYNSTGLVNNTNVSVTGLNATGFINFTSLIDGVYYINATANDSAGNENSTGPTRTITLDNVNPTMTFTCSSSSVVLNAALTCTCTGADTAGSGVSSTSHTSPSTSIVGSHTATCTVTDYAGNSLTSNVAYTVTRASSSGGGGYPVYRPSVEELSKGYEKFMYKNWRISFKVGSDSHLFKVEDITKTSAKISISSETQEATLLIGQEKKFDVSGNGYYDLLVKLNTIDTRGTKANFTIKTISEQVISQQIQAEEDATPSVEEEVSPTPITEDEGGVDSTVLWIVVGAILILILVIVIYKKSKKKSKK